MQPLSTQQLQHKTKRFWDPYILFNGQAEHDGIATEIKNITGKTISSTPEEASNPQGSTGDKPGPTS